MPIRSGERRMVRMMDQMKMAATTRKRIAIAATITEVSMCRPCQTMVTSPGRLASQTSAAAISARRMR